MRKGICLALLGLFLSVSAFADGPLLFKRKVEVHTNKTGLLLGFQQAKYFTFDLGLEHQWKKLRLKKQRTYGVHGRFEYALKANSAGYKLGFWTRQGRLGLTYGLQGGYYTDFEGGGNAVFGPELGLKLMGFHFVLGYQYRFDNNSLDEELYPKHRIEGINPVYLGVRYFFAKNRKTRVKKKKK